MAHHTVKSSYTKLADRLNRFPQGAPPSKILYKILKMLFSEKEAQLVSQMPIKPFTAKKAAGIWKMSLAKTQNILDQLASRAILVDFELTGEKEYSLPPPMAGFFEFSMMRVREDIDQKLLAELFYEYMNVEEDFIKDLFTFGETGIGRTFVHEPALSDDNTIHVLDYERATEVIKTASHIGVGVCYCRHKMEHLGKDCDAPKDICMTFNSVAASLIRHDFARKVDEIECMDLLQEAYEYNLVQFGENVKNRVSFICNCCSCCCEAMLSARRFSMMNTVHTTNFLPDVNKENCTGCGKCINVCPVEAMILISADNPNRPKMKTAKVEEALCLGCGVCVRACNENSIILKSRPTRILTPLDGVHKVVLMAIERGKLQHLIFDNRVLWHHRALAAVLGVILKLPPFKQILASNQLRSRYLETMIRKADI